MDQQKIFITILGMALVTYLPRFLPAWFLASRQLPKALMTWLSFVPPAVMAAMLFPSVLLNDDVINFTSQNLFLLASIPTLLVAMRTRSFFGTIVVGMMFVAVSRYLFV